MIGVDTHKYVHVAVALDDFGGVLGAEKFSADAAGYGQLINWATTHGRLLTVAIEGTGSYGAGLTAAVRRRDIGVVEVMRTDRRDRRLRGKSDFLDAERRPRSARRPRRRSPQNRRWCGRDDPQLLCVVVDSHGRAGRMRLTGQHVTGVQFGRSESEVLIHLDGAGE